MPSRSKLARMTTASSWVEKEELIAKLLPSKGGAGQDRARLLRLLSAYSTAVVSEARRVAPDPPTSEECTRAFGWLDHPVFICGHHRSGTTLLQELLDGHLELLVLPSEGTYFSSFAYVARSRPRERDVDRFIAEWIARLIDPNHEPHFKLGRSDASGNPHLLFARRILGWRTALHEARAARSQFTLLQALVVAFKDVVSPSSTPRMWVEKTPLNELHVRRFNAFPAAKFIHVVRDPSATLSSLLELFRVNGIHSGSAAGHAQAIGRSLRLARTHEKQLAGRYLVVRYEDLTEAPQVEMERVRTFLDISPNASLVSPTVLGRYVRANSAFGRGEIGVVQRSRRTPELSPAHARLISAFTASVARSFRYDVAPANGLTRFTLHLARLPPNTYRGIRERLRPLLPTRRI